MSESLGMAGLSGMMGGEARESNHSHSGGGTQ